MIKLRLSVMRRSVVELITCTTGKQDVLNRDFAYATQYKYKMQTM